MAISNDWTNKSLKIQQIDREQKAYRAGMQNVLMMIAGKGGSPGQPYDDPEKGKGPFVPPPGKGMMISGNPSFDINETPATRRTRKIRTLQERGVGGEAGNAGDILKKGVQLPNIQANVNYGSPTERDKWLQLFQGPGGTLRNIKDPDLRKLILQRGAMKADASNNIRRLQESGHQTVLDDDRPGKLKIIKQFKPKA